MNFSIENAIAILERTPSVLTAMLGGLPSAWIMENEGVDTWSPFDVIGHLIHGEQTDWIPRSEIILSSSPDKRFVPFDRFAQFENSKGKSMEELLERFAALRKQNLVRLKELSISKEDLDKTGIHPSFGEVTLSQLLSTWVVHDLNHISQITRVMSKQYATAVGPWTEFLGILK